jgi:hypothetical protein
MDRLQPLHVAEVALLVNLRYWKSHGIDVEFTDPAILARIVSGNKAFKDYGVRQLSAYIRDLADPAIESAKRRGVRRVVLSMTLEGRVTAQERKTA